MLGCTKSALRRPLFCPLLLVLALSVLVCSPLKAERIALDEGWTFRPDPHGQGWADRWFAAACPPGFEDIDVGRSWESQGYIYDGYGWYRCEFELPAAARGAALTLRFEAVDEEADIWLNETFIDSMAVGWNNPFELDISDYVSYDRPNLLAVRVLDTARQGGIWKPVTLSFSPVNQQAHPVIARLRSQGVRALSAAVGHPGQAQRYVNSGMNLCLSWAYLLRDAQPFTPAAGQDYVIPDIIAPSHLERYRAEARLAKEYDLVYMPNLWLHVDTLPFMVDREYRRCTDFYGRELRLTPCPQSEKFWRRLMLPQMKILAEIQRDADVDGGICLDLEWYAGDFSGGFCYDPLAVQGCYCDACFYGFVQSFGAESASVPPQQRGEFIRARGAQDAYWHYLEIQVARQIRRLCTEIRAIKPDILFGMLPGVAGHRYDGAENWFTRGAVRGMSVDGVPALIFSETEYETGWRDRTAAQLAWLEHTGVPGLLIGGLTIGYFSGPGLGAKAAELVHRADGYWFYHGASLASAQTPIRTERDQQSAHTLREPGERYWQAITQANQWLDENALLPPLSVADGSPLFAPDNISAASPGVEFTESAVSFATSPAGNLLVNGDFTQPFDVGWRSFDAPGVTVPAGEHHGELLYDFAERPGDQGYASCFQTLHLEPHRDYELTTTVMTRRLVGGRRVGVHVCHHNSPRVILSQELPLDAEDDVMHALGGRFRTGDDGRVQVVLLANGRQGQIAFGPTAVRPVETKTVVTQPLAILAALAIPSSADIEAQWRLLDPVTGVAYFGALHDIADLRYLNMIYPECRYQVELSAAVPATERTLKMDQPLVLTP